MNGLENLSLDIFRSFGWRDLLDVSLVALLIYVLLVSFRGTVATHLVRGTIILFAFFLLGRFLNLTTFNWLFQNLLLVLIVALPIIFQPELRRGLQRLGKGKFASLMFPREKEKEVFLSVNELMKAVEGLTAHRVGALMVFERNDELSAYAETGVPLDALVSSELMDAIFNPTSPLHDGAVIIKDNRIRAAGALLPLSEKEIGSTAYGTRHRAALGISEHTDAVCLILSEETGTISLAVEGRLLVNLDPKSVRSSLSIYLQGSENNSKGNGEA